MYARCALVLVCLLAGCSAQSAPPVENHAGHLHGPPVGEKLMLSEAEWKQRLTPEQFRILREKGTERAFTGALLHNKGDGTYACAGCGAPLFDSHTKFDSGSGWPSFFKALEGRVNTHTDTTHGMVRTEITCARCGGHLGHVFDDGPRPTGMRYCVNSLSLEFNAAEAEANAKK
ncbi:MAG: peptide-methionine (R)-S-oxide reductase MsrB [Myxococcales bacterium]|nr:peptide-methionine (R)-S-oxide reductase MsrB [Myxococcales bacterium]